MISLRKFLEFTLPEASEYLRSKGPISIWYAKLKNPGAPAGLNNFCTYVLEIVTPGLKIPNCKICKKGMNHGLLVVGFSPNLQTISIESWSNKRSLVLSLNLDGSISKAFWRRDRDFALTELKNISRLSDVFNTNTEIS